MSGPQFTDLLAALADADVDFVIIGGIAVTLHGFARFTKDLDITYSADDANLESLGRLLLDLRATLRGIPDDVPFVPDSRTLRNVQLLTLDTRLGPLDLLAQPPGGRPYAELRERAARVEIAGRSLRVVGIDDLIAMKRAAGRLQDLADLDQLEAIKRLRGR